MRVSHKNCGGEIDKKKKKCSECGKKWNFFSYYITRDFIPIVETREDRLIRLASKTSSFGNTSYARWAEGTPAAIVARFLPSWPRKYRILAFLVFYSGIGYLVYWLFFR